MASAGQGGITGSFAALFRVVRLISDWTTGVCKIRTFNLLIIGLYQ